MQQKTFRNASTTGGLGLGGGCWAVTNYFSNPPDWLIYGVAASSIGLLVGALYFLTWGVFKPRKEITDKFFDLTIDGHDLMHNLPTGVSDCRNKTQQWISRVEDVFEEGKIDDEDKHMFSTVLPIPSQQDNIVACKKVLEIRIVKLRKITGRYFRGENVK